MKHLCHWSGCKTEVPPKLWGCREHWFKLPIQIRDAILREYRPGQEVTKTPSVRYLIIAALAQEWIKDPARVQALIATPLTRRVE